ncbi:MAG: holin [Atopobiaceae bacterium]|nr:holin [Atopobiaceae bacterium]
MQYFLPDKVYDLLKWCGLIACPALAVFYATVAPAWGWPYPDQIVLTLNALGVLIGVLIGASQLTAREV